MPVPLGIPPIFQTISFVEASKDKSSEAGENGPKNLTHGGKVERICAFEMLLAVLERDQTIV